MAPKFMEQWVDKVKLFSSQYDAKGWAADHLRGEPKVYPKYGDIAGAWATRQKDAHQFAEGKGVQKDPAYNHHLDHWELCALPLFCIKLPDVEFKQAVYVRGIEIYETFHAGGTKRVAGLNDKKQWVTLWETDKVTDIRQSRIFSPPLKEADFKTKDIRIEIDCTAAGTWVEIDAIKLIGTTDGNDSASLKDMKQSEPSGPKREQWVYKVNKFSSQYDDNSWKADNLRGEPNVYPQYGDLPGAWANGQADANQFAEVEFKKAVYVTGIQIYETFHAGGIKRVAAHNDRNQWVTLWETDKVKDIGQSRIFSPALKRTDFKTKHIRIDIDCTVAGTWVEIDAIKLISIKDDDNSDDDMKKVTTTMETSGMTSIFHMNLEPREEQWVKSVTAFSSQYDDDSWKADQLRGVPNVYPQYGDLPGVWATEQADAHQFVEVEFEKAVYVIGIEIYETFHAGGTKRIAARNDKNQWVTLWETDKVTDIQQSRIFTPIFKETSFKTKDIRIEIDCTAAGTWVEIDAIKLIGKKGDDKKTTSVSGTNAVADPFYFGSREEQWVKSVKKFSSQYNDTLWKADQLQGEPKVYPQYGDILGTWATAQTDAHQFAEVEFEKAVYVTGIEIYETFHAGGTKRIAACNDQNQWVTLWETDKVTDIQQSRIFSPPLKETNFKTKDIRIEIDCTAAGTWVEIDAIKLIGEKADVKADSQKHAMQQHVPSESVYMEPRTGKEQWVYKVKKFSSEYNESWGADNLCGKPKVYPKYGDIAGAWATKEKDAHQFAEVAFKKVVYVTGIEIYETYHAGGTKKISALNKRQWVTLWETQKVTDIGQTRIFSPPLKQTHFKTKNIRIEIDCTVANSWVEIDAIKLIGKKGGDNTSDSSDSDSDSDRKKNRQS